MGCLVSVQVTATIVVVVLLATNHDAIAYESSQSAHVRIVWRANPCKGPVVLILVQIDLFPVPVGIRSEWIVGTDGIKGPILWSGGEQKPTTCSTGFKETSSRFIHVLLH